MKAVHATEAAILLSLMLVTVFLVPPVGVQLKPSDKTLGSSIGARQGFADSLSTLRESTGPFLGSGLRCNNTGPEAATCRTKASSPKQSPSANTPDPSWNNLNLPPSPRARAAMVYDAAEGYVLL